MRRLGLNGIGVSCGIVYAANAFHYGWRPAARNPADDVLEWLTVGVLLALYWAGYRKVLEIQNPSFGRIMLPVIPLVTMAFATVPYDSTDAFLYMDAGWAQAHYGLNPYSHVLRNIPEFARDPIIRPEWMRANKNPWLDLPFVYGFLFALVARGLAWLGHGYWWLTLSIFKLLNVAAYYACCQLLWQLSKATGNLRPDIPLYLFAWSPLILLHHIANVHNDLLVGCLVIIAAYTATNRRLSVYAPAALIASAMIKYVTLPLVPLTIWFIGRRDGWRRAVLASLLATIVIILVSVPYARDVASFRLDLISAQINKTTAGSAYAFAFYIYRFIAGFVLLPISVETFGLLLKILLWSIGAVVIAVEAYSFCRSREPSFDDWIATSSWILVSIIFIASSQFYSWYIGMLFPLVLLLRAGHWLRSLLILLSSTHVFSLTSLSRKGVGYFLLTLIPIIRTWRIRLTS